MAAIKRKLAAKGSAQADPLLSGPLRCRSPHSLPKPGGSGEDIRPRIWYLPGRATLALAFAIGITLPAEAQTPGGAELAAKIAALGTDLTPELAKATTALYAPLIAAQDASGVTITAEQSYGPAERNRLDIYAPEVGGADLPVLVYLHGGGFVRGDKSEMAGLGTWFARNGVVAVTMNYRFAPEATFPSGAQDIADALRWIRANIAAQGGDAARVFLAGNSAGAVHVATYVFDTARRLPDDGVRGAILISPPSLNLTDHALDPARDALYFGSDPAALAAASALPKVAQAPKADLLLVLAEHDIALAEDQTRQLVEALHSRDGRMPLFTTALGHNHLSVALHFNTGDDALAETIRTFIANRSGG